jgi:hypothetical protein
VVAHGLVRPRAIPIGGIEYFWRYGMLHLQQPAGLLVPRGIAAYQYAGIFLIKVVPCPVCKMSSKDTVPPGQ